MQFNAKNLIERGLNGIEQVMIDLADDATLRARALAEPGAFAWWYLDLLGEDGAGLVLIWSFGLPFLPDGDPGAPAAQRPSLNLALYQGGRQISYLLQACAGAQRGPSAWTFGDTQIELLPRPGGGLALDVALDAEVPGSRHRLQGHLRVEGRPSQAPAQRAQGAHAWSPVLAAARGRAELRYAGRPLLTLAGPAYVDCNASLVPLQELGIARWHWGHVPWDGGDLVYYLLQPDAAGPAQQLLLLIDPDGRVRPQAAAAITVDGARRGRYGLRWPHGLRLRAGSLRVDVRYRALVEDGPFYQRFFTQARCLDTGAQRAGIAELVAPGRIDIPWQRPFVRMRCHRLGLANSLWLPLFNGPRQDRIGRLFGQLRSRQVEAAP